MRKNESGVSRAFFYLLAILTAIIFICTVSACSCDDDEKHKTRKSGHTVNSSEVDVNGDLKVDYIGYFELDDDGNIVKEEQDWGDDDDIDRVGYYFYVDYNDDGIIDRGEVWYDTQYIPDEYEGFRPSNKIIYNRAVDNFSFEYFDDDWSEVPEVSDVNSDGVIDKIDIEIIVNEGAGVGSIDWSATADRVYEYEYDPEFDKFDKIVNCECTVGPFSEHTYTYEPEGNLVRKDEDVGNDGLIDSVVYYTYPALLKYREYWDDGEEGVVDIDDIIETYDINNDGVIDSSEINIGVIDTIDKKGEFELNDDGIITKYEWDYRNDSGDFGSIDVGGTSTPDNLEEDDYGVTTGIVENWYYDDEKDNARYLYSRYRNRYDEKTRSYIFSVPVIEEEEYQIYRYDDDNRLTRIDYYPSPNSIVLLGTEYVREWASGAAEGEPLRTEYKDIAFDNRYEYEKNYTYYPDGNLWTIDYDDYYDNTKDYTIEYTYYNSGPEDGYPATIEYVYPNNPASDRTSRFVYTSNSFDSGRLVYREQDYDDNDSINGREYFLNDVFGNVEKRVKDELQNGWETSDPSDYKPFDEDGNVVDPDPDLIEEFEYNYDKYMFVDKIEYDFNCNLPVDWLNRDIDRIDYFTYNDSYTYLIREDRDLEDDDSLFGDTVIKYFPDDGPTTQELWDTNYNDVTYDDLTFDPDLEYSYVIYDNSTYYKKKFDDFSVGESGSIEGITYYYYGGYLVKEEIDYDDDGDTDATISYTYDGEWKLVKKEFEYNNKTETWVRGVKINGMWFPWYDSEDRLLREDYDSGDGFVVSKKYYWDNTDEWEGYPYNF